MKLADHYVLICVGGTGDEAWYVRVEIPAKVIEISHNLPHLLSLYAEMMQNEALDRGVPVSSLRWNMSRPVIWDSE